MQVRPELISYGIIFCILNRESQICFKYIQAVLTNFLNHLRGNFFFRQIEESQHLLFNLTSFSTWITMMQNSSNLLPLKKYRVRKWENFSSSRILLHTGVFNTRNSIIIHMRKNVFKAEKLHLQEFLEQGKNALIREG